MKLYKHTSFHTHHIYWNSEYTYMERLGFIARLTIVFTYSSVNIPN